MNARLLWQRPSQPAKWLLAFFISFFLMFAHAAPLRALHFEQLSVKQGLAQETVTSIVQDGRGYMWFGSQNGLSRFDGYRVTVYRNIPGDPRSLIDNWIQALHVDKSGRLWVATRAGTQRFDETDESFTRIPPPDSDTQDIRQRNVKSIANAENGALWFATDDGLRHLDPASGSAFILQHDPARADSLSDNHLTALARDGQGHLWVGTREGLDLMLSDDAKSFRHFRFENPSTPKELPYEVRSLWPGQDGSVWISTALGLENWLLQGDQLKKRHFGIEDGLLPGTITAFHQDRDGAVWVGTNTHGLHYWDKATERFSRYSTDPHATDIDVSSLYQDRGGTLWIGTWTEGVKHADIASGGFSRFFHASGNPGGLSDNRIYGIAGDGKGKLWLGTFGGVDLFNPATGKATVLGRSLNGLSDDNIVLSVFRDSHAQVWLGTSAGLARLDESGHLVGRRFETEDSNSNSITHISQSRDGMLWVATRGGLHRLDISNGSSLTYRHDESDPNSLSDNWVRMTVEDRHGALWVATDYGLDRLDRATGRFSHFRHGPADANSLGNDRVHCLLEDRRGNLWVGTNGGLSRMEALADGTVRFHTYTARDGLPSESIGGILEDDSDRLWVSTTAGISQLDIATGKIRNYTAQDGMIEGYYYVGSAFRDVDGTMYFGGANGLTAFRPEAIRDNPYPPSTLITDIRVGNDAIRSGRLQDGTELKGPVGNGGSLTLPPGQNTFSIEFSALHYADPSRNRFAYRLRGFDKKWIDTDADKRVAIYTNLDPGNYLFEVRSSNKDGIWDKAGATLAVTVVPPIWKTWWFRSACLFTLFYLSWLGYRMRIRGLKAHQRQLENQVLARTSELAQKNTMLEEQKHQLQTAQRQLQRYVDDREHFFMSISHDLRTPITRLKLRSELLDDNELRTEFHDDLDELDMLVKGALQCMKDSDIHENLTKIQLDTMIGRMIRGARLAHRDVAYIESGLSVVARPLALKRALGNLLDNALHYGERAEISAAETADHVEIRVRDFGPGVDEEKLKELFDPRVRLEHGRDRNEQGLGLGLGIARDIITAHGGEIFLANHPEGGLIATIRLPKIGSQPHTSILTAAAPAFK